ncbi:MAG: hypothetical protein QM763_08515 [Agriterribacter sp.]
MKKIKMSLANIEGKLSRVEMKKIMAGSGGLCHSPDFCGGPCTFSSGPCVGKEGECRTDSNSGVCQCLGAC